LLPLVARAHARELGYPHLEDPYAQRMLRTLAVDPRPLLRHRLALALVLRRSGVMDQWSREFLERHPAAAVVNLGAGLCTRFYRIDNGRLRWLDLDVPEVVELRARCVPPDTLHRFPRGDRYRVEAGSIVTAQWRLGLEGAEDRPALVICEGVLVYFTADVVRTVVHRIIDGLPAGGALLIDHAHPMLVALSGWLPVLRTLGLRFSWGLASPRRLTVGHPRLSLAASRPILPWMYGAAAFEIRAVRGQTV
jgi:O-methyltransferase involved in polyketide biosynthesis